MFFYYSYFVFIQKFHLLFVYALGKFVIIILFLNEIISKHPELKVYYITVSWNKIDIYVELLEKNLLSNEEIEKMLEAHTLKQEVISVDSFDAEVYKTKRW